MSHCESAWESNPPRNASAPSAVLKTEDITGCLALSREFPKKLVTNLPPRPEECRLVCNSSPPHPRIR